MIRLSNRVRGRRCTLLISLFGALVWASGCSDDTAAPAPGQVIAAGADVNGQFDPTTQTFKLEVLTEPPPGYVVVPIELLGSNLVIDVEDETVSLDVAMRNNSDLPLYAPAVVWLGQFLPADVTVVNPDITIAHDAGVLPPPFPFGFDYSDELGEDGVLSGGETSTAKTWTFHVPGLTSFAFGARVSFGAAPERPRIAGTGFLDQNRDGVLGPEEFGHPGWVSIQRPDGSTAIAETDDDGTFAFPVSVVGLYRVSYVPRNLWDCICPVIFTTPNPLTVVLPPDEAGLPVSFLDANFGFILGDPVDPLPEVVFSPLPVDSLQGDFYQLLEAELRDLTLVLRVGYSGCGSEHPFTLYMSDGFMESNPVQVNLVLNHDDLGEMCAAHFQKTLSINVGPILARFNDEYGGMGPVQLNLIDHFGQVHVFTLGIAF